MDALRPLRRGLADRSLAGRLGDSVVSIDGYQSPILDHHPGLQPTARGLPGVHRQRPITDADRLGVVCRRRLLDTAGDPRSARDTADAGPSDSCIATGDKRRNRCRIQRRVGDGAAASSSHSWITTICWRRPRSSRWHRPSTPHPTSTTCTATKPTSTPTAASSPASRSPTGVPSDSVRRCTPATSRSCVAT